MKVTIDSNESNAVIAKCRKLLGEEAECISLPVGDLILENEIKQVVFERKTISDLITSTRSGHLQKQLAQMEQFPYAYLIVIGDFEDSRYDPYLASWTTDNHLGIMASINVRCKTKVIVVKNLTQYFTIAKKIFDKTLDGKIISIENTELMRDKITTENIKLRLISALPGISIELGKRILETMDIKLVSKTGKSIEEELGEIKGIGPNKLKKIMEIMEK